MPTTPSNAYTRALLLARKRGYGVGAAGVKRMLAALRDAIKELESTSTATMTTARAIALRTQIRALLPELESIIATETRRTVNLTTQSVVDIHARVIRQIAKDIAPDALPALLRRLSETPVRALTVIAARKSNAATFRTLARRNIQDVAPALDVVIESGVARGLSAANLTKDVAKVLAGSDINYAAYGVSSSDLAGARTLLYDARRIAVTETNNALREANRSALLDAGIVEGATWQRSGRHAGLPSSPDACDDLAEATGYNGEPGAYRIEDWPLAPHPFCACVQGGPVYFKPVDSWFDLPGAIVEE